MNFNKRQSDILKKRLMIYGLGRAGISLARFLVKKEVAVIAYDDNQKVKDNPEVKELSRNQNFKLVKDINYSQPDIIICSPGIRSDTPLIEKIIKNRIPLIDEIEFTSYFIDKPIIAITGTNGKSTTTALIGKILETDQKKVFYGGNLAPGLPFSTTLLDEEKDIYVVEVSSFQLERCHDFSPKIALLLNITEDHFDRHQSKEEYISLKFRIFNKQNKSDYAIINYDDPTIMANKTKIRPPITFFSTEKSVDGAYCQNGMIYYKGEVISPTEAIKLPGKHNLKNVLAAVCAVKIIGVKKISVEKALAAFTGLPHRLELVRELDGVKYVNNSMCTNPDAGVNSLWAISAPVVLITGGKEKNLAIEEYTKAITQKAKYAILIGDNRNRLKNELGKLHFEQMEVANSLEQAVNHARVKAVKGDTVLFSPGFASFDSYANFMERGKAFCHAVDNLT
jgi:UDP-N-acetylmuramoylalanine--D-glutamate ligase